MNGYFEPIIGSSFDSLAAQRFGWAGLNNQTATGNVQRASQAQQEANNYFQQVAANRQAVINRQAEMDWAGRQADAAELSRSEDDARRAHQFDVNTQLTREDIARREADTQKQVQKMDEATQERAREFDSNAETQKKLAEDSLNNTGQALATSFAASQRQVSQAAKLAENLQNEHDTLSGEVADLGKKADKSPEDLQKLSADNARLAELKKVLPKALTAQNNLEQRHLALSDNIQARGFVTDENKGSLTHLETGKTWNFDNALKKAIEQTSTGNTGAGSDYFTGGTHTGSTRADISKIPAGAIAMLKQKPDLAAQFEAKYGPGTSAVVLGK
jgi:chromosome segregation ATPase